MAGCVYCDEFAAHILQSEVRMFIVCFDVGGAYRRSLITSERMAEFIRDKDALYLYFAEFEFYE